MRRRETHSRWKLAPKVESWDSMAGNEMLFNVLHLFAQLFDCNFHLDRNVGQF
jgi:hypothetical protein